MTEKNEKPRTINVDAERMLAKAARDGVETAWDRSEKQSPHCHFCERGVSCRNCVMGPCRIGPEEDKRQRGVCGADADVIVARNLGRMIAAGAAAHSDHGRDLLELLHAIGEGKTEAYTIKNEEKLRAIADEIGVDEQGREQQALARGVAKRFFMEYGMRKGSLSFIERVPPQRIAIWKERGVLPRGIDREVVEMMHRTHMGVDNDPISLLLHSARVALSDGWGGSMIGTELSDIIFGTPTPRTSTVNLGVLKKEMVNILLHGHNPVVSEAIVAAAADPELTALAKEQGAAGINLAGLCCTGNEILMRRGVPMAGNHLMTELALVTGAVEAMIVDYQCIMPSVVQAARCYHTTVYTTSDKAHFPGAEHVEFHPENARSQAHKVIRQAIEAFGRRDPARVEIPVEPVELMTGFSNEAIVGALGGSPEPLIGAIKTGKIRGAVGIVGCNNPKVTHDHNNVTLARECIKRDILVLVTGCVTVSTGKQGLLMPAATSEAGSGLAEVCNSLGIPPILHMGSCVDNSRIMALCALLARALKVDIADLPVAAAAPEWYSEKAATIGLYAVASGIYTVLGVTPPILGSKTVTDMALSGLEGVFGATFAVESDPVAMADLIDRRIATKRKALGLD